MIRQRMESLKAKYQPCLSCGNVGETDEMIIRSKELIR